MNEITARSVVIAANLATLSSDELSAQCKILDKHQGLFLTDPGNQFGHSIGSAPQSRCRVHRIEHGAEMRRLRETKKIVKKDAA
jgi:hypothetical protein